MKIRRGKTDTSRSKVRILFPETLLLSPRAFSSSRYSPRPGCPFYFSFLPLFSSLFGCLACFASLSGRPARQETESRVKTVGCRRVKPGVDSLQRVRYRARRVHVHTYAYIHTRYVRIYRETSITARTSSFPKRKDDIFLSRRNANERGFSARRRRRLG